MLELIGLEENLADQLVALLSLVVVVVAAVLVADVAAY